MTLRGCLVGLVNRIVAHRRLIGTVLGGFAVGAALTVCLCWLSGCAAGRNDATGEIVVGLGVGQLTESANQALSQLGDMVLPGAGGALGLLGAVGIGWARSHAAARAAAASRAAADASWDDAARTYSAAPANVPSVAAAPVAAPVGGAVAPVAPAPGSVT